MNFSLIICTYQRPKALLNLLNSVQEQERYPYEILIIDGSVDKETKKMLSQHNFMNVHYFLVEDSDRGLTKQRNYGISKVSKDIDIVCFLDDDTILSPIYFENLLKTYAEHPKVIGVGGYIINEVKWEENNTVNCTKNYFCVDGFKRKEGTRFKLRKWLHLIDSTPPGFMPTFSHGRSISYLPPSNKSYLVEFFMGGVSSFKKGLFHKINFSTYFEGYGLYEDMDFCLRASQLGELYVNTAATLEHHHEEAGRPNKYTYGKMVVRNGWYVWRVKYSNPTFKSKMLFHLNVIVLMKIRFFNGFYGSHKIEAFTEAFGRLVGWFTLFLNKPKINR
ncbi:MAG: glycosyltransferase [Lutibacter sp.]|uniref:glycosyltransferase family 2 protein n=1 Tax=Lutibacter sp. TaxID=1925666 RepID=UPI00299EDFD6|nr:glycosyltransferase [Lutibacter sp.]MDX1828176.1 glycosyltransferase [Lutibacter sp.]